VQFEENGAWKTPNLPEGVSPLVLNIRSTPNEERRRLGWKRTNNQFDQRVKIQGEGIMVSGKLRINGLYFKGS
jgi:hypothetical protein